MALVMKKSPYIMGIDLGTSTSSVAIFMRGKSEVLKFGQHKTLPSVVSFKEDKILVGYQAKARALISPKETIVSIKRSMGDPDYKFEHNEKNYSPADIASEILQAVVKGAQTQEAIDVRGTLKYAVVCIPANFDDAKKQDTKKAAELAGIEVLSLLEEPVAAAIAYGFEGERDQTILVYDLGGGTFDVSILKVNTTEDGEAHYDVLAKEGIPALGGDDFDMEIMKIVNQALIEDSEIDVFNLKKDQGGGVSKRALREAQQKLKGAAENAKKELSEAEEAQILLPNFLKDGNGQLHNVDVTITREQFENAIKPLLAQSEEAIRKALLNAKMEIDDISRIILVGGSTRIPLVKQLLTDMFEKEPYSDLDPDTIVAQGASIYGASLGIPTDKIDETEEQLEEDQMKADINIKNIVTHYLGIEVHGQRFSTLIEKGIELSDENPEVTGSKEYTTVRDNQTEIRITIYQSTEPVEKVTEEGTVCIGEFFLTGIPKNKRGREKMQVTLTINRENLLNVSASSLSDTGIFKQLEIKRE